jgi:hypothetical protein
MNETTTMHYDFTAIPDADVPQAVEPTFQHVLTIYASEANKTVGVWRAVPDALHDFKPHEKTNPIRTILVHQLLSERRFFAQFVGTEEPPVEELLPPGESRSSRRTSTSTSGWRTGGCHSWPRAPPPGGWSPVPSSAGCSGSGYGCSGVVCCTPAITGPRCRRGCGWPVTSQSQRSTVLPAT